MNELNWDSMSDQEILNLHESRRLIEQAIADSIMDFEKYTGLRVEDIRMWRESPHIKVEEQDGTIRDGLDKNAHIQLLVPMRIIP